LHHPIRDEAENWGEGVFDEESGANTTVRVRSRLGLLYSFINGTFDGSNREGGIFLYINISKTIHHFRKMNPVLLQNRHIVFVSIQKY